MSFTLACVMVKGKRRDYTPKYVHRLRNMVGRHTDRPFKTICLTDRPHEMPEGVIPVQVPETRKGERGWWRKIDLFNPAMPFNGRVLYLDLDTLVVGNLDAILDFPAEFAIAPDSAPTFLGKNGLRTEKGYQSSCIVFDAGSREKIYTEFDKKWKSILWGDQDWIKHICPSEATFPSEWFKRLTPSGPENWIDQTRIVLCVKWKNEQAAKQFPWFENYWA